MSYPLIGTDLDLAGYVLAILPSKIAFDFEVAIDESAKSNYLVVGKIPYFGLRRNHRPLGYLLCTSTANSEDIGEGYVETFVPWKINPSDPCH